jgi:hypothetical protein
MNRILILAVTLLTFSASSEEQTEKQPFPETSAHCKVSGKIVYKGDPPARREIDLKGHKGAREFYKDQNFLDERYVIDKDGGVANVLVYVSKGAESWKFPVPDEPMQLVQRGYIFIPHVFGIRAGQTLKIHNDDEDAHNIHCICSENDGFNIAQPVKDMKTEKVFKQAELPFRIQCDLHIWMQAWCGVFDHPFFCVSAADGSFQLPALPPGKYELSAWHERLGTRTFTLKIEQEESKRLVFTFGDGAPEPREIADE